VGGGKKGRKGGSKGEAGGGWELGSRRWPSQGRSGWRGGLIASMLSGRTREVFGLGGGAKKGVETAS